MNRIKLKLAAIAMAALSAAALAAPSHQYRLEGSLVDDYGGPSLVSYGGTLGATSYRFDNDKGLSLSGVLVDADYTIDMKVRLDDPGNYARLLEFKNRASGDDGLYAHFGRVELISGCCATFGGSIAANSDFRLTLTRTAADLAAYIDGALAWSIASDTTTLFDASSNIAYFFVTSFGAPADKAEGSVDFIRIFGQALTANEVAALGDALPPVIPASGTVPLPGTLTLAGLALGTLRLTRRRPVPTLPNTPATGACA